MAISRHRNGDVTAGACRSRIVSAIACRRIDDPEIKARRRWRMISRGNAVWIWRLSPGSSPSPRRRSGICARGAGRGLDLLCRHCLLPSRDCPGDYRQEDQGDRLPLAGYLRFQYSFFFCRWSSFLVVVVLLYVPFGYRESAGRGLVSAAIAWRCRGRPIFIAVRSIQMRLVGRVTGVLVPVNPDEEPARTVRRAGGPCRA